MTNEIKNKLANILLGLTFCAVTTSIPWQGYNVYSASKQIVESKVTETKIEKKLTDYQTYLKNFYSNPNNLEKGVLILRPDSLIPEEGVILKNLGEHSQIRQKIQEYNELDRALQEEKQKHKENIVNGAIYLIGTGLASWCSFGLAYMLRDNWKMSRE